MSPIVPVAALAAYLLGSCITGYYLVRWRTGEDVRSFSSGSAGARNVGRRLGTAGFIATLIGDFTKGVLAVAAARWFGNETAAAVALVAVVAGHIWPLQLRWRGGKGLATALGAIATLHWPTALCALAATGLILAATRRTLYAALGGALLAPAIAIALQQPATASAGLTILALCVCWSHRENLRREFGVKRGAVTD